MKKTFFTLLILFAVAVAANAGPPIIGGGLSAVDVSEDTNLAVSGDGVVLTGDTLSVHSKVEALADGNLDPDEMSGDSDDDNLVDGDVVEAASTSERGTVELATDAEASTGSDTSRAVTPSGLAQYVSDNSVTVSSNGFVARTGEGTSASVELTECILIEDPATDEEFYTWHYNGSGSTFTITGIACECERGGGNESVVFDLEIDDGSPAAVNGSDITCTTFAEDTTLAGDTSYASGDRMDLDLGTVTNSPEWVSVCFSYVVAP